MYTFGQYFDEVHKLLGFMSIAKFISQYQFITLVYEYWNADLAPRHCYEEINDLIFADDVIPWREETPTNTSVTPTHYVIGEPVDDDEEDIMASSLNRLSAQPLTPYKYDSDSDTAIIVLPTHSATNS